MIMYCMHVRTYVHHMYVYSTYVFIAACYICIYFLEPPQIILNPSSSPVRVTVGSQFPLFCIAIKGYPIPDVQWYSEDLPVYPLPQPYQQLYLVPTDSPHTTTYTCVGTTYSQGVKVNELRINVTIIVESEQLK